MIEAFCCKFLPYILWTDLDSMQKIISKSVGLMQKMMERFSKGDFEIPISADELEYVKICRCPNTVDKVSVSSLLANDNNKKSEFQELLIAQIKDELAKNKKNPELILFWNNVLRVYIAFEKDGCSIVCENCGDIGDKRFTNSYLPCFWEYMNELFSEYKVEIFIQFDICLTVHDELTKKGRYRECTLKKGENKFEFSNIKVTDVSPIR